MLDSISAGFLLLGALIGALRGPFATITGLMAMMVTLPILYVCRAPVMVLLADYSDPVVSNLVYWPLGMFVSFAVFAYLGRKLDSGLAKASGRFMVMGLGAVIGFCSHIVILTLVFSLLFSLKDLLPGQFVQGSISFALFEGFVNQNPNIKDQLEGFKQTFTKFLPATNPSPPDSGLAMPQGLPQELVQTIGLLLKKQSDLQSVDQDLSTEDTQGIEDLVSNLKISSQPEKLQELIQYLEKTFGISFPGVLSNREGVSLTEPED
ncbi:MAG: hypothetical protein H3C47_09880 [Candidatus Cloacimonetes bacterium]|nr:hypothetical protein [Candidatus Cloacimonadota bacterium]